jgi:hypothetical protein
VGTVIAARYASLENDGSGRGSGRIRARPAIRTTRPALPDQIVRDVATIPADVDG